MNRKRKVGRKSKANIIILFFAGFLVGSILTNVIFITGEDATHITIVYSSEKASWMTIAYTDFLNYWRSDLQDTYNYEIKIDMHPYGSSDSIIAILNGEIFPTIWSPASSIWMTFLNTKWMSLTGDDTPIVDVEEAVKIIYSPIVIATWESFNITHNIKGLADVRALNLNPSVDVKMAHTDPRLSNSGYMTTIMAVAAASGTPSENLTMNDLTNPTNQQWLKEFESSAITYGRSTGFLARYMKNEGPNDLNVAFLYENLIRDISSTSVGGKVIAIYPEEGTLYSDHPFCILNADWITTKQREVANEFLSFLNQYNTVISAMEYGFRPINASIPLDPEVFNYENNGISFDLNVPEIKTPTDGSVLLKIPDLWLLCKSTA